MVSMEELSRSGVSSESGCGLPMLLKNSFPLVNPFIDSQSLACPWRMNLASLEEAGALGCVTPAFEFFLAEGSVHTVHANAETVESANKEKTK